MVQLESSTASQQLACFPVVPSGFQDTSVSHMKKPQQQGRLCRWAPLQKQSLQEVVEGRRRQGRQDGLLANSCWPHEHCWIAVLKYHFLDCPGMDCQASGFTLALEHRVAWSGRARDGAKETSGQKPVGPLQGVKVAEHRRTGLEGRVARLVS